MDMNMKKVDKDSKIYLDLDGVFADFYSMARKVVKRNFADNPTESWAKIEQIPNFFFQLEVLEGSLAIYEAVKHLNVSILTALPKNTGLLHTAAEDKTRWVHRFIDPNLEVICTNGWVGKIPYANSNAYLIDDTRRNIDAWVKAGGIGLHHTVNDKTVRQIKIITK